MNIDKIFSIVINKQLFSMLYIFYISSISTNFGKIESIIILKKIWNVKTLPLLVQRKIEINRNYKV